MNVRSDMPYPKVKVLKENKEYARLLSHAYASNESELTIVHLYIYQSVILEDKNPEIAKILKEIAKVEMHHLYLLAAAIKKLGCDPIFADCNLYMESYWNSNYVYYDTDLNLILEIDIDSEKRAIHDYQMLLTTINDSYLKQLINRIILDEQIHLEIFLQLYKSL